MDPQQQRALLRSLLGDLPDVSGPVACDTIRTQDMGGWILETLELDLNGEEKAAAYLARPAQPGRYPAVLYNHYHGGQYDVGKQEFIQKFAYLDHPYAEDLATRGYVALCIDHYNFGERRGRSEDALFKELLWQGKVLWGLMVFDSIRALDYLCGRADVDASRVATLGLSMGSTMAWWLAALDERIKVCADICCMTDFQSLIEHNGLNGHGIYYYVPALLKHFTTSDINALICPRAHISCNGKYDALTPCDGLMKIDAAMKDCYAKAGVPGNWRMIVEPHGHMETPYMRREILAFLEEHL
ncbi:MAG: acetylxylan esterase [Eubacteriales bacterium]|nr:acetylxylan esterase [Eubacteriales bacterium]